MMTNKSNTRCNLSVQNINSVGTTDQIDENIFRASQASNKSQSSKAHKPNEPKIQINKSGQSDSETKRRAAAPTDEVENHSKFEHRKEIPLLQRLKVINASKGSRTIIVAKPLPKEVIVENDDGDGVPAAGTVFSELGVDGILSVTTVGKLSPMKFTFDGIVLSKSSLDEVDGPPGFSLPFREFHEEEEAAPAIIEGLEYELDDESVPGAVGHEEILKFLNQEAGRKERTRSASAELSIELSESQYLRNCEEAVEDKFKIFSPRATSAVEGNQMPIDHGFDVVTQIENEEEARRDSSSSSWIDFNFFGLW